jgi:hypothetical protein
LRPVAFATKLPAPATARDTNFSCPNSPVVLLLIAGVRADWTSPSDFTNLPEYEVGPRCVRDTAGNIHLVWYGGAADSADWEIWYQKWNAVSVGQRRFPSRRAARRRQASAIDSSNNLHVVWHANGNPEEIFYRKATGGIWGATTNLSNSVNRSLNPCIAVNAAGTSVLGRVA